MAYDNAGKTMAGVGGLHRIGVGKARRDIGRRKAVAGRRGIDHGLRYGLRFGLMRDAIDTNDTGRFGKL